MKYEYNKDPMGIEIESFRIIDEIVLSLGKSYPSESELIKNIYRRAIHTSADFDYLENLTIDSSFLDNFNASLTSNEKVTVYTDTNMALSGINKKAFEKTSWSLKCFVSDEKAHAMAKELNITRSMASIKLALNEDGKKIFVIGNAPTAIFQILDLEDDFKSDLIGIIGVPVGFVGAEESKLALKDSSIPAITAQGRKGGSNIAAAIVNALLYYHKGR